MKRIAMALMLIIWLLAGCGQEQEVPTKPDATVPASAAPATEADTAPPTVSETVMPTAPTVAETVPETKPEPEDGDLVKVTDYLPTVRQELAYATEQNFTGQRIYNFTDAYLRYGTVKKLEKVCAELEEAGLGLLIWDGFRPVEAQQALWDICPDETYVSHPVTGGRAHCRGSAVDVTLVVLESGEKLTMPTDFDDFSKYADRDYSDCSEEVAENARLLEKIMKKHGFKPYSGEWWHFSDTDSYPVDEEFAPQQTIFAGGVG